MVHSFDECFSAFPELKIPADYQAFWEKAEDSLSGQPLDIQQKLNLKKSLGWESLSDVSFSGAGNLRLQGSLSVPRRRGLPPVVISFHDYHATPEIDREYTDQGLAHLAVQLRYHHRTPQEDQDVLSIPLFQRYGLAETQSSFPYQCFLDGLRAVDYLTTLKNLAHDRIGIVGRGFGAAIGAFVAWRRPIRALALEQMGFAAFPLWLKDASVDYSNELRFLLSRNAPQKARARKNLEYLDVLHLVPDLRTPTLSVIHMHDALNPPRPAFGFFNRLQCEKTMELFMDEKPPTFKEVRRKSLIFLGEILKEG
ncbi:MAG: acetylxylan esterase [Spirochaetales bacterium]|nr:acetylxylan esterase [Spirochaetales bacterium]